jgi:hypothetical protein
MGTVTKATVLAASTAAAAAIVLTALAVTAVHGGMQQPSAASVSQITVPAAGQDSVTAAAKAPPDGEDHRRSDESPEHAGSDDAPGARPGADDRTGNRSDD